MAHVYWVTIQLAQDGNAGLANIVSGHNMTYRANTKHLYNIGTTLAQCLRRWSIIVHMLYIWLVNNPPITLIQYTALMSRPRLFIHM